MIPARIEAKINRTSTCWLWTAGQDGKGYGACWFDGRMMKAHRVVYLLLVGPIPEGLQLDHLCRVHNCVNPAHLEPVTAQVNSQRGDVGLHNVVKTHCPQGHPYDDENTYVTPSRPTARYCNACNVERSRLNREARNAASRRYRQRKRAESRTNA